MFKSLSNKTSVESLVRFSSYIDKRDCSTINGRVFTSGFSGRLASDNRKSRENSSSAFPTRLKLSDSANFNGILIKFKPPNQVA